MPQTHADADAVEADRQANETARSRPEVDDRMPTHYPCVTFYPRYNFQKSSSNYLSNKAPQTTFYKTPRKTFEKALRDPLSDILTNCSFGIRLAAESFITEETQFPSDEIDLHSLAVIFQSQQFIHFIPIAPTHPIRAKQYSNRPEFMRNFSRTIGRNLPILLKRATSAALKVLLLQCPE